MEQMIVIQVFPTFPWRTHLRIEYLTAHLALLTFARTLREIYPNSISRRFTLPICGSHALSTISTAPAPVRDRRAGQRLPQRSWGEPGADEYRLRQFRERYGITDREAEVIQLMAHGRNNKELAGAHREHA